MALKAMADNNVNITAQEDARLYDYLAGQNADYIIQNVGDSLAVSSTTTSLLVTLGSGEAVVQGRHLTNTDSTGVQLTLPQNTTAYLVLRLDLSQSLGNELSFISTPSLEDDDLNNAGVVRDLVLYQYITDANGVATLTDKRTFNTKIMQNVADAMESPQKTITIEPTQWADGVYVLNDLLITATSNQEFMPPVYNPTDGTGNRAEIEAIQAANLQDGGQSVGHAKIICMGDVPTITVHLRVIFRGEK